MIREMLRKWRQRRSVPPAMRNGAPHEGGMGALVPDSLPVECGGYQREAEKARVGELARRRPESAILIQDVATPPLLWIHAIRDAAQRDMTREEYARLAQRRYEDPSGEARRRAAQAPQSWEWRRP